MNHCYHHDTAATLARTCEARTQGLSWAELCGGLGSPAPSNVMTVHAPSRTPWLVACLTTVTRQGPNSVAQVKGFSPCGLNPGFRHSEHVEKYSLFPTLFPSLFHSFLIPFFLSCVLFLISTPHPQIFRGYFLKGYIGLHTRGVLAEMSTPGLRTHALYSNFALNSVTKWIDHSAWPVYPFLYLAPPGLARKIHVLYWQEGSEGCTGYNEGDG
jgi:hypothetical protein